MAIAEYATGTQAISVGDNHSLVTDSAGVDSETDDGVYQCFIDVSDMVTGDQVYVHIWENGGANLIAEFWLYGPQPFPIWVSPTLVLTDLWDITAGTLVGTVTIDWSIRAVT